MHVIVSSLSEIVRTENINISKENDVETGSDCEVRRACKSCHLD